MASIFLRRFNLRPSFLARLFVLSVIIVFFYSVSGYPLDFRLISHQTVYGGIKEVRIQDEENLLDLARKYDLGYNQIVAANPTLDPWVPSRGDKVVIPSMYVLPTTGLGAQIIINLAEMRLYYFHKDGKDRAGVVSTFPIGVGRSGYSTGLGVYTIYSKAKDPVWIPPPSVRKEEPDMPARIPPGPGNPLGGFILRFSRNAYGIHGTNRPWGVGRRVSHGCIRLYPEDIERLYYLVPIGTLVEVIYKPIKAGNKDGVCFLQIYEDFEGRIKDPFSTALMEISRCQQSIGPIHVDLSRVKRALREHSGIPMAVAWKDGVKGSRP